MRKTNNNTKGFVQGSFISSKKYLSIYKNLDREYSCIAMFLIVYQIVYFGILKTIYAKVTKYRKG